MSSSIRLRPAAVADAPDVAGLLMASRRAFIPYAPMAHPAATVLAWVAQGLIPGGGVTLACEAGCIVGVLAISHTEEAGWIDQLYVAPGRTGQGIGRLLLAHALAVLKRPVRVHLSGQHRRPPFLRTPRFCAGIVDRWQ
ncbi:GNAT superfamily N-acetyltransferase [Silvimonas terrae]|uniref:GNAT superfamily N-acetyltransferase n=1 Tax=Silvimonas terrae TaxID=300266 RepID=A0A840RGR0_9NEIS|nr:GNAT family N-acetyltransferase [Silvimonas terrae]MBB5191708.1 GNAT superfamily N-acetyltransferase [Silvimonas terrae]